MTIGERITAERKKAGLTQQILANRLNFPTASIISQWETGVRTPTLKTLRKIAKSLDVPLQVFISDDDESKNEMKNSPVVPSYPMDEETKKLIDEIQKETEDAGLPWYAGMFNQKLVEAALGKENKETLNKLVLSKEELFRQDMEATKAFQRKREALIIQADNAVLDAILCSAEMMKALQEEKEDKSVVAMGVADIGRSIAAMRESINLKFGTVVYGCGQEIV